MGGNWFIYFRDEVPVYVAEDFFRLDADFQAVPFARMIVRRIDLFQNGPGENIWTVKTGESKLTGTRIKSVMEIAAIGTEDKASRSGFILETDVD